MRHVTAAMWCGFPSGGRRLGVLSIGVLSIARMSRKGGRKQLHSEMIVVFATKELCLSAGISRSKAPSSLARRRISFVDFCWLRKFGFGPKQRLNHHPSTMSGLTELPDGRPWSL